jgi:hypothetical protein
MAEGGAIAELAGTLRMIGVRNLSIVAQHDYQDTPSLTFVIGGPSVNQVTGALLTRSFPLFELRYPQHVARYGTTNFIPAKGPTGSLTDDYGFIAHARSPAGHSIIALFGVWAPGTRIAVDTLLHGTRRRTPAWRDIDARRTFLAVSHAFLDDLIQRDLTAYQSTFYP